jgi:hypothetical protein
MLTEPGRLAVLPEYCCAHGRRAAAPAAGLGYRAGHR